MQIIETLQYLQNKKPITEEWVREQGSNIREYRNACYDFSELREDIEDVEFRTSAANIEKIINKLCIDLFYGRPFRVDLYYKMMVNMETMCRAYITEHEMLECMDNLGL